MEYALKLGTSCKYNIYASWIFKTNNRKFFMIHFLIFLVTFVNLPKNVFYIEEIEVKKLDDRRVLLEYLLLN